MNKSPSSEPSVTATFGVSVREDGTVTAIRSGSFDAGQADEIAQQLVLMAASIRSAARARIIQDGSE